MRGKTCKAKERSLQKEVKNYCNHQMGVTFGTHSDRNVGILLSTIKSIKEEIAGLEKDSRN